MSSSTFIDIPEEKDDQLIIIVNADGTITVDPETLEKLLANHNHHGSNLSVIRVGDGSSSPDGAENDGEGPHVNLTVEGFYSENDPALQMDSSEAAGEEVDPFAQMEPEEIARLESVLKSEEAKEVLGTNLEDNLNSMLDILEGKEEVEKTGATIHHDHSYTSALPIFPQSQQTPPAQSQPQPQSTPQPHRPLTRGGRPRGRGRGIMTRGGSRNNTISTLVPISSSPTVIQQINAAPNVIKTTPKRTFIVTQPTQRVSTQPTILQPVLTKPTVEQIINQEKNLVETPRVVIRRTLIPKPATLTTQPQMKQQTLHQALLSSQPTITPAVSPQEAVSGGLIRTNLQPVIIQKKVIVTRGGARGRGIRGGGRGGRKAQPSTNDEVSVALQAMELSTPVTPAPVIESPKGQTNNADIADTSPAKRTPTVIIRKVGSKAEIVSPTEKVSKVRHIQEDSTESFAPPTLSPLKIIKQQISVPKGSDVAAISTPRVKEVSLATNEETSLKKKKEKKAVHTPVVVENLGPELFSTPDIIRRVSTEKQQSDSVNTTQNTLPVEPEPKVKVEPADAPFKLPNCNIEMTPESLLDSIHAEVVKDDSRLLAEALLLDDLTNDDSQSMAYPVKEKSDSKLNYPQTISQESPGIHTASGIEDTLAQTPRIRKLPPMELPTTRSASKKKAAATSSTVQPAEELPAVQASVSAKSPGQKDRKVAVAGTIIEIQQSTEGKREKKYSLKEDFVSDFEEEGESDEESVNSEDDPDRLWCICKKPHNNRFMICCDGCEEWFHGKCVGVTKAMGQQMEAQGTEWSCPNCRAKKDTKSKEAAKSSPSASKLPSGQQTISSLECIVCRKPACVGSNFCSDNCVKKHAVTMMAVLKAEVECLIPSTRIIVYEKKSGRVISDHNAPTLSTLADWLLEHQTFEVHKLSISNKEYQKESHKNLTKRQPTKTPVELKQTQVVIKQQPSQSKPAQVQQTLKLVSAPKQSQNPKQPPIKLHISASKQTVIDKTANLKQTVLTQRISQSGTKEIGYSSKPAVTQKIQIIDAQPLPPQPQPKTKGKEPKKEDDDDNNKSKKSQKSNEKIQPETVKRSSVDSRKQSIEKPPPKEDKRRDSYSNKEPLEKKKDDKKKDKKKDSVDSGKPADDVPLNTVEPVRGNVRRTIQELLTQRVSQDDSLSIGNEQIKELAVSIEEALFAYFNKDAGTKYKSKFRSLLFNIKDPKNFTLYKKIVDKSISPDQLVRLSPEELASQELAEWREREAKHQLEIIKKNELDLIHQSKTVVLKSRKGEEVIESKTVNISEIESALNRTADDYELENSGTSDSKSDDKSTFEKKTHKKKEEHSSRRSEKKKSNRDDRKRDRSRSHSRRSRSRSREHDRDKKKKDKDRIKERDKEKEREKQVDKAEETLKEIEEVISQHIIPATPPPPTDNSDPIEKELPTSPVEISTPPLEVQKPPPVWQGYLNMTEVTKLYTTAYEVSGSCENLGEELSDQLDCVGRIQPDSVWEYVSRMKKAGTKDIIVIRFQPAPVEEAINYLSLYSYLNSRNRMAVIGQTSRTVKDFYVLPLASHSPIPQVLLPLDGPGFDDYRTHLLLGIIIRTKKGTLTNPAISLSNRNKKMLPVPSSSSKHERSYTPPLPDTGFSDGNNPDSDVGDSGSTTPPLPYSRPSGFTPPLPEEGDEPYSPGEDDPYSPEDSQTILPETPDIQRKLEEVKRQIQVKAMEYKSIQEAVQGSGLGIVDEETPYSPTSSFTPPRQDNIPYIDTKSISFPPDIQDILATFQPKAVDIVKSDPIVKAYTSQGMYYEDEDEREEDKDMRTERPSRDPRQRYEPKQKSSLSQLTDTDLIRKAAEMEVEEKKESYKAPYYYPPQAPPLPPPLPPVVGPPLPMYNPPPPTHYKYSPVPPHPSSPPPEKDRKRKNKFKDRRHPPPPPTHPQRRKWEGASHHGGMMPPHRPPRMGGGGRQPRFRSGPGFDRGRGRGFRGAGGFRPHRGEGGHPHPPPPRFHKSHNHDRNVQYEWDEEIRNFEERKARERKRKVSRSPSPRRRNNSSPPRRRTRRVSSSS